MMTYFIEVTFANSDRKTLINVAQIVNIGKYKDTDNGYVSFNSASAHDDIVIVTEQGYSELKSMICKVATNVVQ